MHVSISLGELLPAHSFLSANERSLQLNGLSIDSREIQPGMAFLACRGEQVNGVDYIGQAIAAGAVAVLISADQLEKVNQPDLESVPVVAVENLEGKLGSLAAAFYGNPSQKMNIVGITGTNGKTSVSHFVAQMLNHFDHRSAVIGTVGYGFLENLKTASHTTPDVVRVHQMMADLCQQGAKTIAMEVSSHALDQGRVSCVDFDQAVFTNLTRDHLDYHGSMSAYGAAKSQLFNEYGISHAIINMDDSFAKELLAKIPTEVAITGYGMAPSVLANKLSESMVCMERYHLTAAGMWGEMSTGKGRLPFKTSLLGRFNLSNLMASVAVLLKQGYGLLELQQAISELQGVAGRMELVSDAQGRLVVVDYAHTPDALSKALQSLREHTAGKLWCVFGCGGDRDAGKRPLMGAAAERYADAVVVTNDNPRSENPNEIVADILRGFESPASSKTYLDRQAAIEYALANAVEGDAILVAGKGHEDYQEVNGEKHYFNDRHAIEAFMEGAA